jgi:hypothetical protein
MMRHVSHRSGSSMAPRVPLTVPTIHTIRGQASGRVEAAPGVGLLLHSGQRRSDVILQVRQVKTGAELMIPVHPELSAIIEQVQTTNLTFLMSESGKPFTAAGFSHWFRTRCNEQDYPSAVPTASERPRRGGLHRARDRGHHGPRQPARDRALHQGCRSAAARTCGHGEGKRKAGTETVKPWRRFDS